MLSHFRQGAKSRLEIKASEALIADIGHADDNERGGRAPDVVSRWSPGWGAADITDSWMCAYVWVSIRGLPTGVVSP